MNHLSNRNGDWMQGRGYRPNEDERSSRFGRIVLGILAYGIAIVALVALSWPILFWIAARIGL